MPKNKENLAQLCEKLDYQFQDKRLLEAALSHRSYQENNNERLEFLGDSILNTVITIALFKKYPDVREGELSRIRASLVREETLASLAVNFKLGNYLRLGAGERKSGGAQRDSILADTVEAIIGAMYLDQGIAICEEKVLQWYAPYIETWQEVPQTKDPKSSLQEYLQSHKLSLPIYSIVNIAGAQHQQTFHVECRVKELSYKMAGSGNTRRRAEQEAAQKMLEKLQNG
jgi:ribonuclease-3